MPRNGAAIAIVPAPDGGVYALAYDGDSNPEDNRVVKPKYNPETSVLTYVSQRAKAENEEEESEVKGRRRRRGCAVGIVTGSNPKFTCIRVSCIQGCTLYFKEAPISGGKSIFYIFCQCGSK